MNYNTFRVGIIYDILQFFNVFITKKRGMLAHFCAIALPRQQSFAIHIILAFYQARLNTHLPLNGIHCQ